MRETQGVYPGAPQGESSGTFASLKSFLLTEKEDLEIVMSQYWRFWWL
jgi:hypothetical protein